MDLPDQNSTKKPPGKNSILKEQHPVILFDGICNLCNASVDFIIKNDPERLFRFAPLQSRAADVLLETCGNDARRSGSVVLVQEGKCYTRSDAALRIFAQLRKPYRWMRVFLYVPAVIRNAVYDLISRNRYQWFGRRTTCRVATADEQERFLA